MSSTVEQLRTKIQDFIQHPRRQAPLLKDKPLWNMLASAFDTLADTEMAIQTYEAMEEAEDPRLYYLAIYGLLQAMYVQQDAVEAMMRAFEPHAQPAYKIEDEPDAGEIRAIPNKAVGHPTKDGDVNSKKKPGVQMSYYIVQHSMRQGGFTLMTAF